MFVVGAEAAVDPEAEVAVGANRSLRRLAIACY